MTPGRFRFGNTDVEVGDGLTTTTLPDGARVDAVPHDTDEYRATAERLGYGPDTLRLCREHELAHAAVSHLIGLHESPTLRSVVDGSGASDLTRYEEAAVMAVQSYARAAGVDLLELWRTKGHEP